AAGGRRGAEEAADRQQAYPHRVLQEESQGEEAVGRLFHQAFTEAVEEDRLGDVMGVTFIGNPFDQEGEYDDSDWEMNTADEWIMPPQEIAFIDDVGRATINVILRPGGDSESSGEDTDGIWAISNEDEESEDEDYNPDEDEEQYDDVEQDLYHYYSDSDEDVDYVTYPLPETEEQAPEVDKVEVVDAPTTGEASDTD
ncbi:hypothetical protein NQ315_000303, partial [Exocentrus adspersus]